MIETHRHDAVLELRLARPPVNALDPGLVVALRDALQAAPAIGARAVVISGNTGLFSAGLDVPALLALDRAGMLAFWRNFIDLLATIARCPVPTVAAIGGHSPAGGAVMAIFCDYRVMARGTYRIGLNEVAVGLMVPEVIQLAFKRLVGVHRAERLMVAGAMIDSAEALRVGMVDELVDADHVVQRALAWCNALLALPREAMLATRRAARADLHALMDPRTMPPAEDFIERWFGEETQASLRALVEKLRSKGKP